MTRYFKKKQFKEKSKGNSFPLVQSLVEEAIELKELVAVHHKLWPLDKLWPDLSNEEKAAILTRALSDEAPWPVRYGCAEVMKRDYLFNKNQDPNPLFKVVISVLSKERTYEVDRQKGYSRYNYPVHHLYEFLSEVDLLKLEDKNIKRLEKFLRVLSDELWYGFRAYAPHEHAYVFFRKVMKCPFGDYFGGDALKRIAWSMLEDVPYSPVSHLFEFGDSKAEKEAFMFVMDVILDNLIFLSDIKEINRIIYEKLNEKFDYYNRKEERRL